MTYYQIWEKYNGADALLYERVLDLKKCYEIIGEFTGRKKYTIKRITETEVMSITGKEAKATFEAISNPPESRITAYPC